VNSVLRKIAVRIYLDVILIPKLINKYQITAMLAFGNFLLSPVNVKKVVLLHHPYLFDNSLLQKLPIFSKLIEKIKRFTFWVTLKNVDVLVVQSPYVLEEVKKVWTNYKSELTVIPNPISKDFITQSVLEINGLINQRVLSLDDNLTILYVSRFYPHKNHAFLLALSSELTNANIKHQILVTVDPEISGADVFLNDVASKGLPILNLGEIKQIDLVEFYKTSHFFLFPSKSETFGNPLIEAMSYGLPVIVPSLQYAHSVVGESGIYYEEDNAKECAIRMLGLIQNVSQYTAKSLHSHQSFARYPNATDWCKRYLDILRSNKNL
jgi:glycosyltransferase involved in cell wall biosynthesis